MFRGIKFFAGVAVGAALVALHQEKETKPNPDDVFLKTIHFERQEDAIAVLQYLRESIQRMSSATLALYYDRCGISHSLNDHFYGWRNLNWAWVKKDGEEYCIHFPKPEKLGG